MYLPLPVFSVCVQHAPTQVNSHPDDCVCINTHSPKCEDADRCLHYRLHRACDAGRQSGVVRCAQKDEIIEKTSHDHDEKEDTLEDETMVQEECQSLLVVANGDSCYNESDEDVAAVEMECFDRAHFFLVLSVFLDKDQVDSLTEHAGPPIQVCLHMERQITVACMEQTMAAEITQILSKNICLIVFQTNR